MSSSPFCVPARFCRGAAVTMVLAAACGDDATPSSRATDASLDASGPQSDGDAGAQHGGDAKSGDFSVRLVPARAETADAEAVPGFTTINGKVYDGPVLAETEWLTALEADGCELLKPSVPFCDPGCVGEVCVAGGTCLPNPTPLDLGEITVSGLTTLTGDETFALKAVAGNYSAPAAVDLPYPAFAEGDTITLRGQGAVSFELSARGVAPLELTHGALVLDDTKPLALSWKPPTKAGISRIQVKLDISHHGGSKGKIECDVEDTGSLEIAPQLIAKLTSLGVAGFPSIVVTRQNVGSAKLPSGRVDLTVYADVEQFVEIPGLTSCTDDSQCADGKTCQDDQTCK